MPDWLLWIMRFMAGIFLVVGSVVDIVKILQFIFGS